MDKKSYRKLRIKRIFRKLIEGAKQALGGIFFVAEILSALLMFVALYMRITDGTPIHVAATFAAISVVSGAIANVLTIW